MGGKCLKAFVEYFTEFKTFGFEAIEDHHVHCAHCAVSNFSEHLRGGGHSGQKIKNCATHSCVSSNYDIILSQNCKLL